MRKKLTVLGNAGQLGQELVSEFTSRGYIVSGLDRAEVDIADRFQVEECIGALDPSIVVNAAAYNQVDVAEREPQAAFAVNVNLHFAFGGKAVSTLGSGLEAFLA